MPDAPPPLVGQTLGKCRIEKLLGRGGMGEVYLAKHLTLNKPVAVKVLPAIKGDDRHEALVKRFIREAQQAARLEHPNVVQVYDVGLQGGYYYIVMQYVAGRSVEDLVRKRGRLPPAEALALVAQAAAGLAAAHEQGIIHRDVKPSNLLVDDSGRLKVADFGLSRQVNADSSLSQTGQILGTPNFISPEQARGDRALDGRTDIYSLGATLFTLLTGRPLFEATTPISVVVKHVTESPPVLRTVLPDASPALQSLLDRMLAKDPDQRYRDCRALLADLSALTGGVLPGSDSSSATVIRGAGISPQPGALLAGVSSTPTTAVIQYVDAAGGGVARSGAAASPPTILAGPPSAAASSPAAAGNAPAKPPRKLWSIALAAVILVAFGAMVVTWVAGMPSRAALAEAELWAKAHPSDYAEVVRRFEEVSTKFPTTPAGKQAAKRAEQTRTTWIQNAEEAARKCISKAREFEKKGDLPRAIEEATAFPTNFAGTPAAGKVTEEVSRLKDEALKKRITARVDGFSQSMMQQDMQTTLTYVDPEWIHGEGRNGVEAGLKIIAGVGKLLKATIHVVEVRLNETRDRAKVEIEVQVGDNAPKKAAPQDWVYRDGEWYMAKSENPVERPPRPGRDRPPKPPPPDTPPK